MVGTITIKFLKSLKESPIFLIFIFSLILMIILGLRNYRAGTIIMILLTLSSFLYIISKNDVKISLPDYTFKVSFTIFLITYLFSMITLFYSLERTMIYFILISISTLAMFLQICSNQSKSFYKLILIEILFYAININSSVFIYPVYNGYGDILFHQFAAQNIIQTGHIKGFEFSQYIKFPLTSTLSATFKLATNIPSFYSWVIPISTSYLLSIIFTFYIALNLNKDYRFGLLCSLFLACYQSFILWGSQLTPTSFCFGLFALVVYIIVKNDKKISWKFILMLIAVTMVLSHNLITVITLSLLLLWFISDKINIFSDTKSNYSTYLLFFGVLAISYWIYNAYSIFFENLIFGIKNLVFTDPSIIPRILPQIISTHDLLISHLPDAILIFLSLIFIFKIIEKKEYKKILSSNWMKIFVGLSIFIMYALTTMFPYMLLNVPVERLDLYGSFFLIFLAVGGIIYLSKKNKLVLSIVLSLFFVFSFVSSVNIAYDSVTLEENKIGVSSSVFNNSDVTAGYFVRAYMQPDKNITTDVLYYYYLNYIMNVNSSNSYNSNNSNVFLIREGELKEHGLKFIGGNKIRVEYTLVEKDFDKFESYNRIYDDNDIILSR